MNLNITTKLVTPNEAERILALNTHNRPLNRNHVARLAKEMREGRWQFNGDTICLNGDQLIDGQHRLHAIRESRVTVPMLVVEGLPSEVFATKDTGKRRSAGDTLAVDGEKSTTRLAACLAIIGRYLSGRMEVKTFYSNAEISHLLQQHPEARQSVAICANSRLVGPSVLAAFHYLFARIDRAAADKFVDAIMTGNGAVGPLHLLRERLISNSISKSKLSPEYVSALIVKAWNASRLGLHFKFLRFRDRGNSPETFPTIQ